jgi:hypothetical protein
MRERSINNGHLLENLYLISAVVMSPLANLSLSKLATDASPNKETCQVASVLNPQSATCPQRTAALFYKV